MVRGGSVYILTNTRNTVLYTGVASDLVSRLIQHRDKIYPTSFTAKYKIWKLVFYENFNSIEEAIQREKYIKGKVRKFKIELIESMNPQWRDLGEDVLKW
jgi:putative endonuclease